MHLFHLQLQLINHFRDQQWQTPPYFFMVLDGAETTLELAMMEVLWHRRLQGPHLISVIQMPNKLSVAIITCPMSFEQESCLKFEEQVMMATDRPVFKTSLVFWSKYVSV